MKLILCEAKLMELLTVIDIDITCDVDTVAFEKEVAQKLKDGEYNRESYSVGPELDVLDDPSYRIFDMDGNLLIDWNY